jgi:transcriptional regulator GlxA family with amidase domain
MKTILVVALDGVLDSSLAITLDALRSAEALRARAGKTSAVKVSVVGHGRKVRTGGGLRMDTDLTFREVLNGSARPDWLVVPGLSVFSREMLAARFQRKDAIAAIEFLQGMRGTRRVGASCSAVFLLAEAGLLEGRRVTTTWWLAQLFRNRYPGVKLDETRMLVRDGRHVTAGSAFAQLDLALAVITDTMGASIAHLCSRYLLIDHRPSQARYMIPSHVRQSDPVVLAAERWIDENLARPVSVTDLASALAVSQKTLGRRIFAATGVSPVRFLQRRRVSQATHLIETTRMTIDDVAARVGYQDGTALRKLIKRELGLTPAALRA